MASPLWTGITAIIAVIYCLTICTIRFHLTKLSDTRNTTLGKRIVSWSHLSIIFMTMCPIFMILTYYHPELINKNICLCQEWFSMAVICYCLGLFCLKMTYLQRLDLILNPKKTSKLSYFIPSKHSIPLWIEAVAIVAIQIVVIKAECNVDIETNSFQHGCTMSFEAWNGWLSTGFLVSDIMIYFVICGHAYRQFVDKIKAQKQLIYERSRTESERSKEKDKENARKKRRKHKHKHKHRHKHRGDSSKTNTKSKTRSKTRSSTKSKTNTNQKGETLINMNNKPTTTVEALSGGKATPTNNTTGINTKEITATPEMTGSLDSYLPTEEYRASQRLRSTIEAENRKLKLAYSGLLYQFRITVITILVCIIDLVLNTIFQDYNLLWIFMIDVMINVSLNFIVYSDSRHFVKKSLKAIVGVCHDKSSFLIDVCCCMAYHIPNDNDNDSEKEKSGQTRTHTDSNFSDTSGQTSTMTTATTTDTSTFSERTTTISTITEVSTNDRGGMVDQEQV